MKINIIYFSILLPLLLGILLPVNPVSASTTIQSDDFENGLGIWSKGYPTGTDDFQWLNWYDAVALPKFLSGIDDSSQTFLAQTATTAITGQFDYSVNIYKRYGSHATQPQLRLYDTSGNLIAYGGIWDGWASSSYKETARVYSSSGSNYETWASSFTTSTFSKTVRIYRDASDYIHVLIGGIERASYYNPEGVKEVQLHFRAAFGYSYDQELIGDTNSFHFDNFIADYPSGQIQDFEQVGLQYYTFKEPNVYDYPNVDDMSISFYTHVDTVEDVYGTFYTSRTVITPMVWVTINPDSDGGLPGCQYNCPSTTWLDIDKIRVEFRYREIGASSWINIDSALTQDEKLQVTDGDINNPDSPTYDLLNTVVGLIPVVGSYISAGLNILSSLTDASGSPYSNGESGSSYYWQYDHGFWYNPIAESTVIKGAVSYPLSAITADLEVQISVSVDVIRFWHAGQGNPGSQLEFSDTLTDTFTLHRR